MSYSNSFFELYENGFENSVIYNNVYKDVNSEKYKEAIKNIIKFDPENLIHFISVYSVITDQKDILIDNKNNFLYTSFFNNNGEYLSFSEKRLLFTIKERKNIMQENVIRVFLNGRELQQSDFTIKNSLSSIRVFVKESLINNGDTISIINEKYYKTVNNKKPFQILDLDSDYRLTEFSFLINREKVGNEYLNPENILIFIKKLNSDKFTNLIRNTDYQVDYDISENKLRVNMLFNLFKNEKIMVVNKLKKFKMELTTSSNTPLSLELYETLTGEYRVPFPVENVLELDVFVNGYKLFPERDYGVSLNKGEYPVINFNGLLKQNSKVIITSRNHYSNYHISNLQNILTNNANTGYFSFLNTKFPLSEKYIEVFANRKKISPSNIKVLADCILQVKNLKSFKKVEVRTNFALTENLKELLDEYELNPSRFQEIANAIGFESFINQYKVGKPSLNNSDIEIVTDSEIFSKTISSIKIYTNKTQTIQGYNDIIFSIKAVLNDNSEVDITNFCKINPSIYDFFEIGEKRINATFKISDSVIYSDNIDITILEKEIENIFIVLENQYIQKNSQPKFKVYARYSDFSVKNITNESDLNITYTISSLNSNIKNVNAEYKGFLASSQVEMFDTLFKTISDIDVRATEIYKLGTEQVNLNIRVIYTDGEIQEFTETSPGVQVTGFNSNSFDPQNITVVINKEGITNSPFTKETTIDLEQKLSELSMSLKFKNNTLKIFANTGFVFPTRYKKFLVKNLSNEYLTLYKVNIPQSAVYFGQLENSQPVKIEFFDENDIKLDEIQINAVVDPSTVNAPIAFNKEVTVIQAENLIIDNTILEASDVETNSNSLIRLIVDEPSYGTLNLIAGSLIYTAPLFSEVPNGKDTFTFKVKDSNGLESNVATITVNIDE
jgi:hypothetical protein